jgi:soluble lytic murein transglycosylase
MYADSTFPQYCRNIFIACGILFFLNVASAYSQTLELATTQALQLKVAPGIAAKSPDQLNQQRQLFIQAEAALNHGHLGQYKKLESRLKDYPLYPYLQFIELERSIKTTSDENIQTFVQRYHNTPLANKLYYRWINSLARKGEYKALVRYFRPTQNTHLLCHYANALHEAGQHKNAYSIMDELWQSDDALPKSCDPILKKLNAAGYMTPTRLWERIHLMMNKGKSRIATKLAKSLAKEEQNKLVLWKKVQRHPKYVIEVSQQFKDQSSTVLHWILVDGMTRLSRKQPLLAAKHRQEIQTKYHFNASEKERIGRHLALSLARAGTPLSRTTLQDLKLDSSDTRVITPHILSAINDEDWQGAIDWLNRLNDTERNSERWHYWRARALEELGRLDEARSLYLQITDNRSYYSFLSADRIGNRYQLTHHPLNAPAEELSQLQHIPAIARAGELYQLKRIVDARREWHFAIQSMNKKQLLLAAQLANKWGWHDRSIITLALAQHWEDLELRFPLVHKKHIEKQARSEKINPAWAFAVIRQESGFTSDARSSSGALGLMQLMPSTARQVAQSLHLTRPKQSDLLTSDTNIKIGIRYLRKLSERFGGNSVLATAAYNAGQLRVKDWLPKEKSQSADLWIENVPFSETRKYLMQVLTYTVIYEQRLGLESTPLLERMLPIAKPAQKIVLNP